MDYDKVDSTAIAQVGYDESAAVLAVRFHDGREYHYLSVPEQVYRGLLRASSVGAYFHQHVRHAGYRFHQIGSLT